MRYIVYGAGAIGGAIGGRLALAGADVVLIARGAHLERMRADGLTLRSASGDNTLRVNAIAHPRDLEFGGDEVVLLTMKSQDTPGALEDLRAAAGDRVVVVCAQNGVENERLAARHFERTYAMLVSLPATFMEPGLVVLNGAGPGGRLHIGRYPVGTDATAEAIAVDLVGAGFDSLADADVMRVKYGKLLLNLYSAVNALCPPGLATDELVRGLRAEAEACFIAAGIIATDMPAYPLDEVPGAPRVGTSSRQSLARGTGSIETDYLNGEISLLGTLHGIPTPLNRAMQLYAARAARERAAPGSIAASEIVAAAAGVARGAGARE